MWPAEIRQTILNRIAAGESLNGVCKEEGMPGFRTVMDWLEQDEDFRTKYACAREAQADVLFDGMADVENRVLLGELKPDAARVVLDSQRWRAEKLKPKVYGNKVEHEHKGGINLSISPTENRL